MNEREELMRLLTALISAQDDVSRMSDRGGPQSERERQERIVVRNEYRNKILAFFDEPRTAALAQCVAALTCPGEVTSKHGNVPDTLRHLADLMVEAGDKSGWVLWLRRVAGAMDEALVQAQEALGTD